MRDFALTACPHRSVRPAAPRIRATLALALALPLAACAVSRSGPSQREIERAGQERAIDLVEATAADAALSREGAPAGFPAEWRAQPAVVASAIGVGDVLNVVVFERDGLNLFPAGDSGGATLSGLTVDAAGTIQLPYVGQVHVAGLTLAQARTAIMGRMRRLALSLDLTVALAERHSMLVSVQGDVVKPGVVPLAADTARLSALLGAAGPTPTNLELASVTVRRGGQSATVRLSDLYEQPQDDIALRAGDVVIVRSAPAMVSVLGAAGLQGRVRITRRNYSVVDAVADARGLSDVAASPRAVYLMALGTPATAAAGVPRVVHFDFRNPAQIAVAAAWSVRDGDAILISNAPFTQSQKVLSAFSGVLGTARSATLLAN